MAGVHVDRLKGSFLETYDNIYDPYFNKEEKNILLVIFSEHLKL